jgi:hypothetical protein
VDLSAHAGADLPARRAFLGRTAAGLAGAGALTVALGGTARAATVSASPQWYDVRSYGAVGDGVADDTTSLQNTIAAAAAAGGGTVYLPTGKYKISSPLVISTGLRITGDGQKASIISSTTASSLFSFPADASWWEVAHVTAVNSGGHIFAGSGNLSAFHVHHCSLQSNSNTSSIWTQSSGTLVEAYFSYCDLSQGGSAPLVAAFDLTDPNGGFNACVWEKCVCTMESAATASFFNWVCTSSGTSSYGNVWRDVVFEQCNAGAIYALAHFGAVLDNVSLWDSNQVATASSADFLHFGRNAANIGSRGITVRNCMRSNSTLGSGKYDLSFDAWTQQVLVENFRAAPDSAAINLAGLTGAQIVGSSVGTTISGATVGVAAATGAGTAPPAPTVTGGAAGTSGTVSWGTGMSPKSGAQVSITFGTPLVHIPTVTASASNAATAALQVYVTNVTATGFTVACATTPAASQPGTAYSLAWTATS